MELDLCFDVLLYGVLRYAVASFMSSDDGCIMEDLSEVESFGQKRKSFAGGSQDGNRAVC